MSPVAKKSFNDGHESTEEVFLKRSRRSLSARRSLSLGRRGLLNILLKKPLTISFEITHSCNAKCRHCHLGGGVKEDRASPQVYARICRTVKPAVAQFSGGEPLLRQDLEDIVRAVRIPGRAPFIVVTTNAALLTKNRYDALLEAGVDEFSISLDYPDERHDEFRRIPGLFDRIKMLIEDVGRTADRHITLCCVIQRDNFRDLPRMAELARKWNVGINFSCYTPLRTSDLGYMIPRQELDEFKEISRQLVLFKKRYKTIFTTEYHFGNMAKFFEQGQFPRCRTAERFCNVNPDGTFSPCGLIITDFKTLKELKTDFARTNTCAHCLTSIRANCEQPLWRLARSSLQNL
jgi:MoaA/NifB/PqqE/SkfB family radical SAM enzyme